MNRFALLPALHLTKMQTTIFILFLTVSLTIFLYNTSSSPHNDPYAQTFERLKELRQEKKLQTLKYFRTIETSAQRLNGDKILKKYFVQNVSSRDGYDPQSQYEIDKHFIKNYGNFYDLLFVDTSGFVFHSIRQEDDFRKNLFDGDLGNTNLAKVLKGNRQIEFSEFEYYYPSDEPATFFIVPISLNDNHLGWFILQCAINKVNTILTDRHEMGRTEEVYLVNQDMLMLSDSRFIEDGTILKLKVDTETVRQALDSESGESMITDYRGQLVYSAFEKFQYFNTDWIIISEIDEAEVITEHYKRHKQFFNAAIIDLLSTKEHHAIEGGVENDLGIKVDINEWAKGESGQVLKTLGVSTCTAFAIQYPGKFAYLAHISSLDKGYGLSGLASLLLRDKSTDFIGELLKRVSYYDIYPSELSNLGFLIVATHVNSFPSIVDRLLEQDIELDKIRFIYNPNSRSGALTIDVSKNDVKIFWYGDASIEVDNASDYKNLGEIVKGLI